MATAPASSELIASFARPQPADWQQYRLWMDGPVLRIDARGDWNLATAQAYAADVALTITALRASGQTLRAIVDRREILTYDEAAGAVLMATYRDIPNDGDRIAMVVDSSVMKGRIRQIAGRSETQSFLSVSAARTWVLAYG